jgi:aspartate racemase
MKVLGVLGGMSWESTALYYRLINQGVAQRLGGLHSADLRLHSVDFAPVAALQAQGDWPAAARLLAGAAAGLKAAGAQGLVLATNTMHKVAAQVQADSGLPLLHIADATGAALRAAGVQRAALLGTRFTMEDASIVREPLAQRHGVQTAVPDAEGRALMHRVIYDELCRGVISNASRDAVVALIEAQRAAGAQAVILGCTEITLLIDASCSPLPLFDTTALHACAAVDWMLDDAGGALRSHS